MSRKPYRLRTWLRGRLPEALSMRIPKGRDCGDGAHDWYFAEEGLWACYHCEQETRENPYPPTTWARYRAASLLAIAAEILESSREDEEAIELVRSSMAEAGDLLKDKTASGADAPRRSTSRALRHIPA